MKHTTLPLILLTLVLLPSAFAAEQIGTVTASETFELAGTQVPTSAARSVPLMDRDQVKTSTSTAIIMLEDGSRIAVDKNSALRLQRLGAEMLLCLEEGSLRFNAAEGSRLVVCALNRRIELQGPSEGTVSINGPAEVLANVEKGAPVVVIENEACTCEPATPAPLLTDTKPTGAGGAAGTGVGVSTQAIVIIGVGAAAATAASIAVFGGDEELPPRSPAAP